MSNREFQRDLLALMGRHRFQGVPQTITTSIREAKRNDDQDTLNEYLIPAVQHMLRGIPRRGTRRAR